MGLSESSYVMASLQPEGTVIVCLACALSVSLGCPDCVSGMAVASRLVAWVSAGLVDATIFAGFPTALSGESIPEMCDPSSVVCLEVSSSAPSGW
jgi:hypothetical protein